MTAPVSRFGMADDDQPARYVERGGELVYRQPFLAEGVRLYGFVLEAHQANLSRAMYRTFTEPSNREVEVEAFGHCVLLAFMTTDSFRANEAPDNALGVVPETEAAIWVPVRDKTHDERYWTLPYMFVDRAAAMAAGRETYGFPKQLGEVTVKGTEPPESLCARVPTIVEFGPKSTATIEEVISVTRPSVGHPPATQWADPAAVHRDLIAESDTVNPALSLAETVVSAVAGSTRAVADAPAVAALLMEGFVQGSLPVLLLKQFRSSEDPAVACYQSIVHVDLTIKASRRAARLPDDYTVDLGALAGAPLVADLGLPTRCRPAVAFSIDFDFEVPRGSVVWSTSRPGR